MVDPWRDCQRLYSPHFCARIRDRFLPEDQVFAALINGKKIKEKRGEYTVLWNGWTIIVSQGNCFLTLQTAFR